MESVKPEGVLLQKQATWLACPVLLENEILEVSRICHTGVGTFHSWQPKRASAKVLDDYCCMRTLSRFPKLQSVAWQPWWSDCRSIFGWRDEGVDWEVLDNKVLPWVLDFVPSLFPEPPLTTFVFTLHFFCWKIKNTFFLFFCICAVENMCKLGNKIFPYLLALEVSLIQQDWGGTGRVGCMLKDFPSGSAYPKLLRPRCSTLSSSKAVWLQLRYWVLGWRLVPVAQWIALRGRPGWFFTGSISEVSLFSLINSDTSAVFCLVVIYIRLYINIYIYTIHISSKEPGDPLHILQSNVEHLSSQDIRKIEGLEEGAELERLLLNVAALVVMDADQQGLGVCLMDFL